ncbi:MAG: MATE family efflux transporter [Anaerotignum sp.]|nr:MATE family efflux transporter [Anaerotignum sp.]
MNRTMVFEHMPVRQAVLKQIIPAVFSQMIALIYSLADTYFVGMLNAPAQTAAITIVYPSFVMLTAISNLFGIGGASLIARKLGRKDTESAQEISSISFWLGLLTALLFSLFFLLFANPILTLCGAAEATYTFCYNYAKWVVVFGGIPTIMNTLLANLVRSEGSAASASFGVSLGGILNIILDPIFILPQFLGMGVVGAGVATALSNLASMVYFLLYLYRRKHNTILNIHPIHLKQTAKHLKDILSIGFPSALQYGLTVVAVAAQSAFVAKYATEATAALGIVKKLDQLPLYFSIGVANGLLPLLAYNHSAGNETRRRDAFRFGTAISVGFALLCVIIYESLASQLASLFIEDQQTIIYGAAFLRRMVLAMPFMAFCYPMTIQFQAMGKVREALTVSILRKGVLDVPLLFLMDGLFPLYGCMWVQPIVDCISLFVASILYLRMMKGENYAIQ